MRRCNKNRRPATLPASDPRGGLCQHLFDGALVAKAMEHADDKLARFRVRRDATVDRDGPFPGVIGGQDQGQIVGVAVHQRFGEHRDDRGRRTWRRSLASAA